MLCYTLQYKALFWVAPIGPVKASFWFWANIDLAMSDCVGELKSLLHLISLRCSNVTEVAVSWLCSCSSSTQEDIPPALLSDTQYFKLRMNQY